MKTLKCYLAALTLTILPALDAQKLMAMSVSGVRQESYKELGEALAKYPEATLMVGDAGIIPYYAKLKAYDSLGLADMEVAHNGLSSKYMAERSPDLVFIYRDGYDLRLDAGADATQYAFVSEHDYVPVGAIWLSKDYALQAYLKPSAAHFYALKSDLAWLSVESEMTNRIRDIELLPGIFRFQSWGNT